MGGRHTVRGYRENQLVRDNGAACRERARELLSSVTLAADPAYGLLARLG